LGALSEFLRGREAEAEEASSHENSRLTYDEIIRKDVPYQIYNQIYAQAKEAIEGGNKKPKVLYDVFFSSDDTYLRDVAKILQLDVATVPDVIPSVVRNALQAQYESYSKKFKSNEEKEADTTFWMLRSIVKNGKVAFSSKCSFNDYKMYLAIMAGQKTAARHGVRTSKRAKEHFRARPGQLGIVSTGPTGTAEEQFASLSRYARGDSLFDYDEVVRNTGFKLNPEQLTIFITQPPSMGDAASKAQESLIQQIVKNRGNTVFCAYRNGFKIYNPKEHRRAYEQHFRSLGWECQWHAQANQLVVHDQPMHIHGHRFYDDMKDKISDPRHKPKLVEFIHMPSLKAFKNGQEIVRRAGKKTSIKNPDTHRAYRFETDQETGEPQMALTDYLTPSFWLFRLRRKYGLQYGGVLEMVRAVIMKREGNKRSDGLDVRSTGEGFYAQSTASRVVGDLTKAARGIFGPSSARRRSTSPSRASVQKPGTRPLGPAAGSMLRFLNPLQSAEMN